MLQITHYFRLKISLQNDSINFPIRVKYWGNSMLI